MYIKLCDRCGRHTNNLPTFLLPTSKNEGSYNIEGQWFGRPISLCNNCLEDFESFRIHHENFNKDLIKEKVK